MFRFVVPCPREDRSLARVLPMARPRVHALRGVLLVPLLVALLVTSATGCGDDSGRGSTPPPDTGGNDVAEDSGDGDVSRDATEDVSRDAADDSADTPTDPSTDTPSDTPPDILLDTPTDPPTDGGPDPDADADGGSDDPVDPGDAGDTEETGDTDDAGDTEETGDVVEDPVDDADTDTGDADDADDDAPDGDVCTPEAERVCDEDGNVIWLDSCGVAGTDVIEVCRDAADNGACRDGVCGCADGLSGPECDVVTVFVDGVRGDDGSEGETWERAVATLDRGLDLAEALVAEGEPRVEVWVAAGVYVPSVDGLGDPRTATFAMRSGVHMYGGFVGTEGVREGRTPATIAANATVLSGDLSVHGEALGRAYHVVTGANDATLDGFLVRDGQADGPEASQRDGGGLYNMEVSPTVANVVFRANRAGQYGAAAFSRNASPSFANVVFEENEAGTGGALYAFGGNPSLTNVLFEDNWSPNAGGGFYAQISAPDLRRVTFAGNRSAFGGAVYLGGGSATFNDVTFTGSHATSNGGAVYVSGGTPTFVNVTFTRNRADVAGGGVFVFSNARPTFTNVVFAANHANVGGGLYTQFRCHPVITSSTFAGNTSAIDGQAIHTTQQSTVTVINSIVTSSIVTINASSATARYSLLAAGTCAGAAMTCGDAAIEASPVFVDATGDDPTAWDLTQRPPSPGIDAGDNGELPAGITADRAGLPRIVNATIDMGAFETQN